MKSVGIDFGDRFSRIAGLQRGCVSVWDDSQRAPDGNLPSTVFINDRCALVGMPMASLATLDVPGTLMKGFKYSLDPDEPLAEVNGNAWDARMGASLVFKKLVSISEMTDNRSPDRAVIAVPAWFENQQKEALRFAGEAAGIKATAFVPAVSAAAQFYYETSSDPAKNLVIFDMGAGPATTATLALDNGGYILTGHNFDEQVSGVKILEQLTRKALGNRVRSNNQPSTDSLRRLHQEIALVLEGWMTDPRPLRYTSLAGTEAVDVALSEYFLKSNLQPFVDQCLQLIQENCRICGVEPDDIDTEVLLLGGALVPLLRHSLLTSLNIVDQDPGGYRFQQANVLGAAMLAQQMSDSQFQQTSDCDFTVTNDVCLRAVEHDASTNDFALIKSGTPLPTTERMSIYTKVSNSESLNLCFTQAHNDSTAKILFEKRMPLPNTRGKAHRIDLKVNYAIDGTIGVTITDPVTGQLETCEFKEKLGGNRTNAVRRAIVEGIKII